MPLMPAPIPIGEPSLLIPQQGLVRSAVEVTRLGEDGQPQATGADGSTLPRWVGGFIWEPQACGTVSPFPIGCVALDPDAKAAAANPANREFTPYAVVGADSCSALDQERDREARARQVLLATESWQIAREFWRGDIAREGDGTDPYPNDYLARGGAEVTDLGTQGLSRALAALEQFLAGCLHGQRGMIHATPYTATLWQDQGLLTNTNGLLTTAQGTIVVADAGYDGSAPGADDGDDPVAPSDINDAANAYATGLVYLARGTIKTVGDMRSQIDRATNDWTVFVERPVAAWMDGCCHATIEVDHTISGVDSAAT